MFNLHETYQLKVYDNMHNVVNTKTFNSYPTVEEIQAGISRHQSPDCSVQHTDGLRLFSMYL